MFKTLCLGFMVFSLVSPVWAGSLADAYRLETKKVLSALDDLGIKKIACTRVSGWTDCHNPSGLTQKIDQVKWVEFEWFFKGEGATRWGAFYSPSENTIFLNKSARHDPKIMGYIGLHELLGVMGIPEDDFSITMAAYRAISIFGPGSSGLEPAWRMDDYKASIMITPDWAPRKPDPDDNHRLFVSTGGGGGVFVGGGGGDTRTFLLRAQVFEHMKKYIPRLSAVDVNFGNVAIEIVKSEEKEIRYRILGGFLLDRIFVPEALLEVNSPRDPKVSFAVEDISWFLASANPDLMEVPVKGRLGFYEPLSLQDFHPEAIKSIWCLKNIFGRPPIEACKSLPAGLLK